MERSLCLILAFACALAAGCTPGAITSGTAGGMAPGNAPGIVQVSLTAFAPVSLPAGTSGGFSPARSNLAVGSTVQFVNADTFAHTATGIPNATTFPAASPFTSAAQNASGSTISSLWSSGTLQAGASSQVLTIDRAGTYLYGCFFHYAAPMRGEIVAF